MIPASASVHSPAVSSSVGSIEVRAAEEEVVSARIAGVDAKVEVACVPVERTIEVRGVEISLILPVQQDVAQVHVALSPVGAV